MSNVIVTILEKLKLTAPFRNEKSDYILMHDKETGEVSAVPVDAVLAKVNDRVNALVYPDGFTKTTPVNRVGNTVTIAANDFAWRINLNPYTNADAFEQILDPTTSPELKRIDTLAATKLGTIVYYQGEEDEFVIQPPNISNDELRITDLTIFGDEVQEHTEPTVTEIYTLSEKDKLAILDPTTDIDKPVSTAQAAADAAVLAAANEYADIADATVLLDANAYTDAGLATKLNAADYNDRFKSVYLSLAALNAAHPTASAGDSAQVNEPGSTTVINYYWDAEDGLWVSGGSGGSGATNTDALPEGSSNLYWTTVRGLALVLTGLSAAAGTFTSSDTVLTAFGKIKYLIDNIATTYQVIITDVNFGAFINGLTGKTTPVDADSISIVDSADSNKQKKVSWANIKATLLAYFDTKYLVPQITITTSVSITTATNDASGFGQKGRNVIIDNSTNEINITVNGGADFCASYLKHGTGTITFVQGSGRTLTQVDGIAILNGAVGSTAIISSVGTKDYLRISNA